MKVNTWLPGVNVLMGDDPDYWRARKLAKIASEKRTCKKCTVALGRYNAGPECYACEQERKKKEIEEAMNPVDKIADQREKNRKRREKLRKKQITTRERVLKCLYDSPDLTSQSMAVMLELHERTVQKHMSDLCKEGLAENTGIAMHMVTGGGGRMFGKYTLTETGRRQIEERTVSSEVA